VRPEVLSQKKSNDPTRNRNHDPPPCRAVHQPTASSHNRTVKEEQIKEPIEFSTSLIVSL